LGKLPEQAAPKMESNEFDGAFKKKAPPRASRRRQAATDADEDPDKLSSVPTGSAVKEKPDAPSKGWGDMDGGDEPAKPAPSRRRRAADKNDDDDDDKPAPTMQSIGRMDDEEDEGGMSYIPDLEDEEEQISLQVAQAPSLKSSRVQTIMELDEEIDMALPSTSEIGVDLSVLQSYLMPQEQVAEEDEPWDFEHELQTIASAMQIEQEEREGDTIRGMIASPPKKKKEPATEGSGSGSSSAPMGRTRG